MQKYKVEMMFIRRQRREFLSRYPNAHTRDTYRRALKHFHEWLVDSSLNPLSISRDQADDYVSALKRDFKRSSRATHLSVIRTFYQDLAERRIVENNPWHTHSLAVHVQHTKVLSKLKIAALYHAAELSSSRDFLLVRLLYEAGLRREEVASLSAAALRLSEQDGYGLDISGTKGGRVQITADLAHAIMWEIETHPSSPWVFPGYMGDHINIAHVNGILKRLDPDVRPYQLRVSHIAHTAATGARFQDIAHTIRVTVTTVDKHECEPVSERHSTAVIINQKERVN